MTLWRTPHEKVSYEVVYPVLFQKDIEQSSRMTVGIKGKAESSLVSVARNVGQRDLNVAWSPEFD
jgi:hypothetical protein